MLATAIQFIKDVVIPIFVLIVLPLYFWFQRDRRKSRAETAVVERTVDTDVGAREAGGLGASVAFVQEAFRVERESKDRQIAALEQEVHRVEANCKSELKAKLAEKDEIIAELRETIAELMTRLERVESRPT